MVFSSNIFLFFYLPLVLGIYYIAPRQFRNGFLFVVNLIFYGWGEPVFLFLMLFSIFSNYLYGMLIHRYRHNLKAKRGILVASVIINLGQLAFFKYADFIVSIVNSLFPFMAMAQPMIPLPIGISFYIFQTMSYTIDVYREDAPVQRNVIAFGTYVALFPQLIAGPIVRYRDVAEQMEGRRETVSMFADGTRRFICGMAKKILLANQMGLMWELLKTEGSVIGAWMGLIAYALQIYFDFSGYSDMAIGLGKMLGFTFLENFNYPYISRSITEFWRRWHISLSTWFRDYVYIPLGGNRSSSKMRVLFNLFLVWLLTGVWHGANWTFLCWGLFYFVLLMIERFTGLNKNPRFFCYLYTLPCVIAAWVLFRAETISAAWRYLKTMCGLTDAPLFAPYNIFVLGEYAPFLILGAIFSLPILPALKERNFYLDKIGNNDCRIAAEKTLTVARFASIMFVFLLAVSFVVKSTNNPFIYFNF